MNILVFPTFLIIKPSVLHTLFYMLFSCLMLSCGPSEAVCWVLLMPFYSAENPIV